MIAINWLLDSPRYLKYLLMNGYYSSVTPILNVLTCKFSVSYLLLFLFVAGDFPQDLRGKNPLPIRIRQVNSVEGCCFNSNGYLFCFIRVDWCCIFATVLKMSKSGNGFLKFLKNFRQQSKRNDLWNIRNLPKSSMEVASGFDVVQFLSYRFHSF